MTKRTSTGQFTKGQSGNPAGTKTGSRHKVSLAAESLLDGEAEALTRRVIELALQGDSTALRLCIERLVPVRKERRLKLDLPEINGIADHPAAQARIAQAVASGEISPGEGLAMSSMLDSQRRSIETADLADRMAKIEEALGDGPK